ncbi:MAG: DEAD/DEAH box helicase [Phycisphaerae bacterium]|nr:DEAD/DEAH box helicase [Phycisphaerae bacterium]
MPFKKIGLCDELVQGILATGYTAPTEIQAEAIPIAIAGKDMIGCAQTGTGKTAAFVLPILNRLSTVIRKSKKKKIRSLIITPTRELAVQIDKAIQGYGRFTKIQTLAVYGGTPIEKQIKTLQRGVDIMVATPGRLIDHLQRGTVDLSTVEILVLDEADRMLDMGFINDIKKIIEHMPSKRQTLLFSATISKEITTLTKNIQQSPEMIQIGKQHNPIDTITQHIYPVSREQKMSLLLMMIEHQQMYSILIFSRTKRGADRICRKLKNIDIQAAAIHSDRTQNQRMRALEGFKSGKYQVMVATDIAARGINVEGISHVINYDVPAFPEDYVHRIGRTGRAEATGDAITFVSEDEVQYLRNIERFIDRKFKNEYYDDFNYSQIPSSGGTYHNSKPGAGQGRKKKSGTPGPKGKNNRAAQKKKTGPSDRSGTDGKSSTGTRVKKANFSFKQTKKKSVKGTRRIY